VSGFADFDRYCAEHDIAPEDAPESFAQWLANASGEPIIGGPVDEPPTVAALPDEGVGPLRTAEAIQRYAGLNPQAPL
jgi:hypothetical protein